MIRRHCVATLAVDHVPNECAAVAAPRRWYLLACTANELLTLQEYAMSRGCICRSCRRDKTARR